MAGCSGAVIVTVALAVSDINVVQMTTRISFSFFIMIYFLFLLSYCVVLLIADKMISFAKVIKNEEICKYFVKKEHLLLEKCVLSSFLKTSVLYVLSCNICTECHENSESKPLFCSFLRRGGSSLSISRVLER